MRLGVVSIVRSAREVVDLARRAESAGLWGLGVVDTAPRMYQGAFPTITASLLATERLRVGPMVSNPVSLHWSVHAATAKALEELTPGRFFAGLATGDGAVHSVGLKPAKWSTVEAAVAAIRELVPDTLEIHIAASGPKGVATAGRIASDLALGVGLDTQTVVRFTERARAARSAAGIASPLRVWGYATVCFVEREEDVESARRIVRSFANAMARFTYHGTYEDKGVPPEWQGLIRERLARYDFDYHAKAGDNPNSTLFEDRGEIQEFLIDQMLAVGTPRQIGNRLADVARSAALDGFWVSIVPTPVEDDPRRMLELVADAVKPALESPGA
jgi:alkanesulfonate monooxygenase SsuD/methylene tetrahydromethanopterin reductase-like flavin-dependent oxidoreductase (luciferase family)